MTKFQIMSDMHQEFYKDPIIKKENIAGEVLLLAGDITAGSVSVDYIKDFGMPVKYVLGNHDYYGRHWAEGLKDFQARFAGSNVQIMENDTVVYNGVRIIAATLWTDFYAPMPSLEDPEVWVVEHQGMYCRQGMSDFGSIAAITVAGWVERYEKSRDYIKTVLSHKHDGPTIVMTHHAPSFKSSHPKYDNSAIKGGFCSNLDWLIEEYQPELWIHGHCHESFDYMINKTRVLCNPRGYHSENSARFDPQLIIEL